MVVDTSAIVAILRGESDAEDLSRRLNGASRRRLSAANYLEAGIVVDGGRDAIISRRLDQWLVVVGMTIEPVTEHHARIARQAYRDFGRGSGHPARLNFGDCFAYALAIATDEPLLFKGDDFIHTDITPAAA